MHKSLDYEDFVDVHYDAEGEASMLSANTILMNRIAADAATAAQENIDTLADEGITLPLGSALGSGVFSGKGPRLRFEILPVGTVKTAFVTEFESAGINQTRHKISLEATASVRIVLALGRAHGERARLGADGGEHTHRRRAPVLHTGAGGGGRPQLRGLRC